MAEDFMALYKGALEKLSTGGMSLQAGLQGIEEGKKQAIAGGSQALVSSSLSTTTNLAGIPLQAEKNAATQRLAVRGQAEQTYLSTLASFANFAQRSQESELDRKAALERQNIATQGQLGAAQWGFAASKSGGGGGGSELGKTFGIGSNWGKSGGDTSTSSVSNADNFPTLYGNNGLNISVPSLMGEPEETEPATGSVPYGSRTGPTMEEPGNIQQGMWYNYITGEKSYGSAKPAGGYAPNGWQWMG